VVFKIDLRGHGDSEGEAGGAYYSGDYVIDTLNAYAALENTEFVDSEAIGLWGHSMAGNVTFRAFVASRNIPALVVWAGAVYTYSDLSEFRIDDDSYHPPPTDSPRARERVRLRETYGEFDASHEFWRQIVPTNYLDDVTGAIELHHATDDNVVSIDYSRNLMDVLDGTAIGHELVEYPAGGHNLSGNTFTAAMNNTVEFFVRILQ
jgi:dipeptidyl aminopeptidase/acylaminoacyl peptidase